MGRLPRHGHLVDDTTPGKGRSPYERRPFDPRSYEQYKRDRERQRPATFSNRRLSRGSARFAYQRTYPPARSGSRNLGYMPEEPPSRARAPMPFWRTQHFEETDHPPRRRFLSYREDALPAQSPTRVSPAQSISASPAVEVYPANDGFEEPVVLHSELAGPQEEAQILNEAGGPDDFRGAEYGHLPRLQAGGPGRKMDGVPPTNPQAAQLVQAQTLPPLATIAPAPPPPRRVIREEFLYKNERVSQSRFLYSVNRFPALVMVVVGMWLQFGRDQKPQQKTTEELSAIFAIVAGLCTLVGELYGLHNVTSRFIALIQTYYRLGHLVMKVLLGIAVFITSAAAIHDIQNESSKIPDCLNQNIVDCYSHNQRLTYVSVIMGVSIMMLLVSILSFGLGFFALQGLLREEQEGAPEMEYKKLYLE